jgi:hypothetical protein
MTVQGVTVPLFAALLLLSDCEGVLIESGEEPNGRPLPESCAHPGGTVQGHNAGLTTWRALDGPHRLRDSVSVAELIIEPGAIVCAAAGGKLAARRLTAEGTAARPIIFAAEDPAAPWDGILTWVGSFSHVRLTDATQGMTLGNYGGVHPRVTIENSVFRRIQGAAVHVAGLNILLTLRGSEIDSACLSTCRPFPGTIAAVSVQSRASFELEDFRITNSGAEGLYASYNTIGSLLGGTIEGSAGIGLRMGGEDGRGTRLDSVRPIRITGGASYPARIPLNAAALLLSSREAHDGWRGNARDTVLIQPVDVNDPRSPVNVHPGLVWKVPGGRQWYPQIDSLRLHAGAKLMLGAGTLGARHLLSLGTAEAPVEITVDVTDVPSAVDAQWANRILLESSEQADTARLVHTRLRGVRVESRPAHPARFEDVLIEDGAVALASAGSSVRRVRFQGVHVNAAAALTIAAANVDVSRCDVTASARDGIRVLEAAGVRVHECNISGNAGAGVRNLDAALLDARHNWWGDPRGPGADEVAGAVDVEPVRAEPVETGAPQRN